MEQRQVPLRHLHIHLHPIFLHLLRLLNNLLAEHLDIHRADENNPNHNVRNNPVNLRRLTPLPTPKSNHRYNRLHEHALSRQSLRLPVLLPDRRGNNNDRESLRAAAAEYCR